MAGGEEDGRRLHILMFPWLALGHMTTYLHLSNELAKRGHKISFVLPNKAQVLLRPLIRYPSLITFHPLSVPHVAGLPPGTETASDIPMTLTPLLATALDLTRPQLQLLMAALSPDLVFYDFAHWLPEIAAPLGVKSVSYNTVSAATLSYIDVTAREDCFRPDRQPPFAEEEIADPPAGYPSDTVLLRKHETRGTQFIAQEYGADGITFFQRRNTALKSADAIAIRTCMEIEGDFCDYVSAQFQTRVLLTGPVLPEPDFSHELDEQWATWLAAHPPASVVYCSLGSQIILSKEQFQEIVLGFELSGYPFLLALKPPTGCATVEEAFPDGFRDRIRGKGVVHGGWVQQLLLLNHPSVGCFVSHCGFGSMWESLLGTPQIVLMPGFIDQILNTRFLAGEMKVAVEVAKDNTSWVTRESLSNAVKEAMDHDSEVGNLIRANHHKWRNLLGRPGFITSYVDNFIQDLQRLLH